MKRKLIRYSAPEEDIEILFKSINRKLLALQKIYRTDFLHEFPMEVLQYAHFFSLEKDIYKHLQQNIEVINKIYANFLKEITGLYLDAQQRITEIVNSSKGIIEETEIEDRRFKHPDWDKVLFYKLIKDIYLCIFNHVNKLLSELQKIDEKHFSQVNVYIRYFMDAVSPSNFLFTNPEVLEVTRKEQGLNLIRGFNNFLSDLVLNKGHLIIRMTDLSEFRIGDNIAATPGKVVYQNDLIQLIQYSPKTTEVYKNPILFIPPWINKYYILDLTEEKSMVNWLVEQGFTVFMISWINPNSYDYADKSFADYMLEGPIAALNYIKNKVTNSKIHLTGYCIGGTLLGCVVSYLQNKNINIVKTATYLTTLLDFSNPGELGIFIDEQQLKVVDKLMQEKGYLDGRLLGNAFNLLRPNDLIWPYCINNYFLGKKPKPFDMLHWNYDSTNLPAKMYSYYLKNCYLENNLIKPGGMILDNIPIEIKKVSIDTFFVACEHDHITPWHSVYESADSLKKSNKTFILSKSGHVAGVINHPSQNKYSYIINELDNSGPEDWRQNGTEYKGSWWPYWLKWLIERCDGKTAAVKLNPEDVIEDAPGSYVRKTMKNF